MGWLDYDNVLDLYSMEYTPEWEASPKAHPLSPQLPLGVKGTKSRAQGVAIQLFFQNLLPEGDALDHLAKSADVSKSSLMGLLFAAGKETTGAIRITLDAASIPHAADENLRLVTDEELSLRIRTRSEMPFSIWDGKVRISIAGYQDKIGVYELNDQWFFAADPRLASTVIVKPLPTNPRMASLPDNELICMRLARNIGLPVARTWLRHVPEPVLCVSRFDRSESSSGVRRLHIIDGCQALGLSSQFKYERPYGNARDVENFRDGASLPKLFDLLASSPNVVKERLGLLRWVIFQVLISNTDAHAKNVSFFFEKEGLRLAPAYDMVCMPALGYDALDETYAMAIGDAFTETELSGYEWAHFAYLCGLPIRQVARTLADVATKVLASINATIEEAVSEGASETTGQSIAAVIRKTCIQQLVLAPMVLKMRPSDFHAASEFVAASSENPNAKGPAPPRG